MNKKYTAFISYKHHPIDSAIAAEVQKKLENYRIPKRIAEKTSRKQIGPIFRDKEELPITSDINEDIRAAITGADFLIVICSPRSKEAVWVNREIRLFLETHDRNHILAVLAEGEPNESFPEIITYDELTDSETGIVTRLEREPLAADLRRAGVSASRAYRSDEITRLAAAVLGVGFDELKQRQKQQQRKRRTAVFSSIAAVGLLFLAYMIRSNILISRANGLLEESNAQLEETNLKLEESNTQLEETNIKLEESYELVTENYEQALRNQSRYLSSASQQVLAENDRYMAIELALQALPNENNPGRPLVSEALFALNDAAGFYDMSYGLRPICSFRLDSFANYLEFNSDASLLAAADSNGGICVFDVNSKTIKWKSYADLGLSNGIHIINDSLLLQVGDKAAICYELETGTQLWKFGDMQINGCVISGDGKHVIFTGYYFVGEDIQVPVLDSETGETEFYIPVPEEYCEGTGSSRQIGLRECINGTGADASGRYMVCGIKKAYRVFMPVIIDLEDRTSEVLPAECKDIYSCEFGTDGKLYFMLSPTEETGTEPYGVIGAQYNGRGEKLCCAYDTDNNEMLWQTSLEYYIAASDTALYYSPGSGRLTCVLADRCYALNAENGEILSMSESGGSIIYSRAYSDNGRVTFYTSEGKQGLFYPDNGEIYLYDTMSFTYGINSLAYCEKTYAAAPVADERIFLFGFENTDAIERFEKYPQTLNLNIDFEDVLFNGRYLILSEAYGQIACVDMSGKRVSFVIQINEVGCESFEILGIDDSGESVWLLAREKETYDDILIRIKLEDGSIEKTPSGHDGFGLDDAVLTGNRVFCYNRSDKVINAVDFDSGIVSYKISIDNIADDNSSYSVLSAGNGKVILTRTDVNGGHSYLLFDSENGNTVYLCETGSDYTNKNMVFIAENGGVIACAGRDCIKLFDGSGTEIGSIPVAENELRSITVSPEGDEAVILHYDYVLGRYSLDGTYLGPISHISVSSYSNCYRWIWTDDELWFWDNNRLLSVINRDEWVCEMSLSDCAACYTDENGTLQFVCYTQDNSRQYTFGTFARLSLEEQISAANEILAEYEMPQEYKDFYGIA